MMKWIAAAAALVAVLWIIGYVGGPDPNAGGQPAPPQPAASAGFDCRAVRDYSSCASGVGALAGRITASALSCNVPAARWTRVGERLAAIITQVATSEADRQAGMRMMRLAAEETLRRRQSGEDRAGCASIVRTFDDFARSIGVP